MISTDSLILDSEEEHVADHEHLNLNHHELILRLLNLDSLELLIS